MAVTLQTKTPTSAWTSVFPTETIQSEAQSLAFMKKFTAVGVSNILYLRSDLPDDTFVTQSIDGLRVTMLKNSTHPVANEICKATKNAVRALKVCRFIRSDFSFPYILIIDILGWIFKRTPCCVLSWS